MGSEPEFPEFVNTESGHAAFMKLGLLAQVLLDEANVAFLMAQELGDPRLRRSFVRAAFAYFDGVIYAMKQLALANGDADFSTAERSLLAEKSFDLDERGRVRERTLKLATLPNLRFA